MHFSSVVGNAQLTRVSYTGQWGATSGDSQDSGKKVWYLTEAYVLMGTFSSIEAVGMYAPWAGGTTTRVSITDVDETGTSFGVASNLIYLPGSYQIGGLVKGAFTVNTNLVDLKLGDGGIIETSDGALIWTTGAVPEPSHYAGILGIIALGAVACRRRRR
jgi:hypothetical protein